jgi:hypothetical protein
MVAREADGDPPRPARQQKRQRRQHAYDDGGPQTAGLGARALADKQQCQAAGQLDVAARPSQGPNI